VKKTLLLLPFLLLFFLSSSVLSATPQLWSNPAARWQYQVPNQDSRDSGTAQIVVQGQKVNFGYDGRRTNLKFSLEMESWIKQVGEITVDGEMLSAYSACYDQDSPACQINYHSLNLYLDQASINQLQKGKELRTTIKAEDGRLYTIKVPLSGTSTAIRQVHELWKNGGTNELMFALLHRNRPQVEALLAQGQNLEAKDSLGRTPLSIVAPDSYGEDELMDVDRDLMRLLVRYGVDLNVPKNNPMLVEQADYCSPELVQFLLDLGADPNVRDSKGRTALLRSRYNRDFRKVYNVLTAAGANKYAVAHDGRNLLHSWAIDDNDSEAMVKFLLEEGFDVNKQDELEATALAYAAIAYNYDTMRLLLKEGAKADLRMKDGSTLKEHLIKEKAKALNSGNQKKADAFQSLVNILDNSKRFKIYFKNKTSEDVQVAIRYKNLEGEWVTEAWYTLDSGEDSYLAKTENAIFYYFAHGVDSDWVWAGSDNYYYVQGYDEKKGFKKKTAPKSKRGDIYRVSLTE
jgi:ankyrin repeat protein